MVIIKRKLKSVEFDICRYEDIDTLKRFLDPIPFGRYSVHINIQMSNGQTVKMKLPRYYKLDLKTIDRIQDCLLECEI